MVYRKKYSGTDRPRKMETPTIKRLRMEFMLVNCKKDSPTAAESQIKAKKSRQPWQQHYQSACSRLHTITRIRFRWVQGNRMTNQLVQTRRSTRPQRW
jgi:hypothetical protein